MRNAENPRDTAVFDASGSQGHFFEKTKKNRFQIKSRVVFVPNFRSVQFFVWSRGVTNINKFTHIQVQGRNGWPFLVGH